MKTFTNHAQGARGINTGKGTIWIEPGQSVEIDPKTIKGRVPNLGEKPERKGDDGGKLDGMKEQVAELTKQVETLGTEKADLEKANAELTKQVETLTKPAK